MVMLVVSGTSTVSAQERLPMLVDDSLSAEADEYKRYGPLLFYVRLVCFGSPPRVGFSFSLFEPLVLRSLWRSSTLGPPG